MKIKIKYFIPLLAFHLPGCTAESPENGCTKGKYVGDYCGWSIIQILDGSKIGGNWDGIYDGTKYRNAISAERFKDKSVIPTDSIIYFTYERYSGAGLTINCFPEIRDPVPHYTITAIDSTACPATEN